MSRLVTLFAVAFAFASTTASAQQQYYQTSGATPWADPGTHYCPMGCPDHGPGRGGLHPLTPHYEAMGPYNRAYDNITADDGWDYGPSLFDEFLKDLVRDSYIRMEYLNYRYKDPDGRGLGSGVQGINDPRSPFAVTIAGQNAGLARIPTLEKLRFDHYNGLKATLGVPLVKGTIETNIMWFEDRDEKTEEFDLGPAPITNPTGPVRFIATATNLFGQPANNVFLYDEFYRTKSSTDLFGGEINYIFDPVIPAIGFTISPIIGLRYFNGDEQLQQLGAFDGDSLVAIGGQPLGTPLVSVITSRTENHFYAPQIGFRAEITRPRFTLGIEPKLGLGVNVYETMASTERLRSPGDPLTMSSSEGERLAAVGELSLYGRVHLSRQFTFSLGYSFIFVDQFSRAFSSLNYNDNGPSNPAAIVTSPTFDMFYIQGINVSGEYKF
jgi:hypothetical protein